MIRKYVERIEGVCYSEALSIPDGYDGSIMDCCSKDSSTAS